MESIQSAYFLVEKLGIGVDSNIMLLSLLFVNISTSIFIIFGLHLLPLDVDVNSVTSVIVVTQLLLITSFLSFDVEQFGFCGLKLGDQKYGFAPTAFHFFILTLLSIVCFSWAHFTDCCTSQNSKSPHVCCQMFCKYFVCLFVFVSPIVYWVWLPSGGWESAWPDVVMMFFLLFFQTLLPLYLSKLTARCDCACNRRKAGRVVCFTMVLSMVFTALSLQYWTTKLGHNNYFVFGFCSIIGGISWFNPIFVIFSLYLLFSEFRSLTLFHNVMLLLIYLAECGSDTIYLCSAVVNVQYIVHSFCIPIYIFLLFKAIPLLQPLSTSLFGLYICAFDKFSDLVVVFYFIVEQEPIFAALQLLFIVTGQVVGAISDVVVDVDDSYSVTDKLMAITGFGRIWFTVNWCKESITQDGNGKYGILRRKHKIWDLLYEAFPTVGLQIYAAMTTTVPVQALVISIMISALSVSFSTTMYLRDLLKVATTQSQNTAGVTGVVPQDDDNNVDGSNRTLSVLPDTLSSSNSIISSPKRDSPRDESKQMYLALFVFMVSDFYIRSIPMVMILAIIAKKYFDDMGTDDSVWRSVVGVILFSTVAIFEFLANRNIRIPSHRDTQFILKIFAVSIFSSFHTMLSTLTVLKMDPFYAESVIFSKYLVEHGIRCAIALILCICSLSLSDSSLWFPWALTPLFMGLMIVNGLAMRWIYNSKFTASIPKLIELAPMMSAEKHKVQSVDDDDSEAEKNQSEVEKMEIDNFEQD